MQRFTAIACMLLGIAAVAAAQEKLSLESVLELLRGYLGTYYQAYAATVATEHYTQRAYLELVTLESEFAMVRRSSTSRGLGMWVPARMRELHESGITVPQTGDAAYSDYRQFAVQTRIVP